MKKNYDFGGWATKANLKCSDGRTISPNAFAGDDGLIVPLVWDHTHDDPAKVLGHALLENRGNGVYAYCVFNDTESGQTAKKIVNHGDVTSLSIWANELKQKGQDVIHGKIREVSLVLAGANPGARIEAIQIAHDLFSDEEAVIYCGEDEPLEIQHSDLDDEDDVIEEESSEESEDTDDTEEPIEETSEESEDVVAHSDEKGESMADKEEGKKSDDKTIKQIYETMTDEQKQVVDVIVGVAVEEAIKENDNKEEKEVKHNVFESEARRAPVISHSDMKRIIDDAKRLGSLKAAVEENIESGVLAHSIDTTGMETATGEQDYGINDMAMMFPDYKSLNTPPEFISRNMTWVDDVLSSVSRTPFSRIKSIYANITEDDARAKGYIKGNQKKEEVFTTLKRKTDPQTIYKKQKLDRDDIIDITDFDVVAWLKGEMQVMLNEEIARAILIGDGRAADSDDKIDPVHIRPVATDVPLFNTKVDVNVTSNDDEQEVAKKTINAVIRARKNYKGSGNPTFYTTEDVVTEMLLIEDTTGRKIYSTEAELATALRVKKIVTVEPMEGQEVDDKPLIGIIVNLKDYNKGADKGGDRALFDDFDIDYNQYKYLMEDRMSGALVKPFSALTILKNEA